MKTKTDFTYRIPEQLPNTSLKELQSLLETLVDAVWCTLSTCTYPKHLQDFKVVQKPDYTVMRNFKERFDQDAFSVSIRVLQERNFDFCLTMQRLEHRLSCYYKAYTTICQLACKTSYFKQQRALMEKEFSLLQTTLALLMEKEIG